MHIHLAGLARGGRLVEAKGAGHKTHGGAPQRDCLLAIGWVNWRLVGYRLGQLAVPWVGYGQLPPPANIQVIGCVCLIGPDGGVNPVSPYFEGAESIAGFSLPNIHEFGLVLGQTPENATETWVKPSPKPEKAEVGLTVSCCCLNNFCWQRGPSTMTVPLQNALCIYI